MTSEVPMEVRLSSIRRTLADLEKHGYNTQWGREADLKWLLERYDDMAARAAAAVWLVPDDKLCGELRELYERFKPLLSRETV